MKCDICNEEIEETFLGKIKGTVLKIKKGEKIEDHFVCNGCQKEYHKNLREKIAQ